MDAIEKIIKAIQVEIRNRFTNQYVVSFYFAAAILNWKIVLIVFSKSLDTLPKISLIKEQIHWSNIFWYPVLAATTYVMVAPITAFISNSIWGFVRTKINLVLRYFEKDAYLPIDKSLKLRQEMYDTDKKYLAMFQDVNEVRAEYREQLERMERQVREGETNATQVRDANFSLHLELEQGKSEISRLNSELRAAASECAELEQARLRISEENSSNIAALQNLLDQKTKEAEALTLKVKRNLDVNDEEKKILEFLATNSSVNIGRFLEIFPGMTLEKRLYHINKLQDLNYVAIMGDTYVLTTIGRAFYFEKVELVSQALRLNLPPHLEAAIKAPRIDAPPSPS